GLMQGAQPIVVASDFLDRRRDAVAAVLRAFARGSAFILSNPTDAAVLAAKEASLPAPLLVKVFAKQSFGPQMGGADVAELEKAERYMRKTGLLRSAVDVGAWIDRSAAEVKK
ncbi:MAG: hypothetical protein PHE27_03115, partial [Alphaproteobacteria bacterium]|nr:hypothetical protein [Alphaproteobacteria bacterium]